MMDKSNVRKITTHPGLGDFIWIAQKLINQGEKFHILMPEGQPQRGHQLAELLPGLIESHEYGQKLNYRKIKEGNIQNKKKNWAQIKEKEFFLSANEHLEAGLRIEEFLPDLPTTYQIEYSINPEATLTAADLLADGSRRYIGIYTSAYSNSRNAGGWGIEDWFKLIRLMYSRSKDITFVIVGAPYDVGIVEPLTEQLQQFGVPFINTTGQPLPVVIELLKGFSYFIGFPSGLSIINETLGKDGVMFYMQKDQGIINTWADPKRISQGDIKECLFCEPAAIFDWIKNEYCLFKMLLL
jgi:ADP-heptose:LPS heptosyltransferase